MQSLSALLEYLAFHSSSSFSTSRIFNCCCSVTQNCHTPTVQMNIIFFLTKCVIIESCPLFSQQSVSVCQLAWTPPDWKITDLQGCQAPKADEVCFYKKLHKSTLSWLQSGRGKYSFWGGRRGVKSVANTIPRNTPPPLSSCESEKGLKAAVVQCVFHICLINTAVIASDSLNELIKYVCLCVSIASELPVL